MSVPETPTGPETVIRQNMVEPGDAAPLPGPFVAEDNYDDDLDPSIRLINRGDKRVVVSSQGDLYQEDLERLAEAAERRVTALRAMAATLPPRPVPPEPETVEEKAARRFSQLPYRDQVLAANPPPAAPTATEPVGYR